jgi:hypothetical protein
MFEIEPAMRAEMEQAPKVDFSGSASTPPPPAPPAAPPAT